MIAFIQKIEVDRREANKAKQGDLGKDDFVPGGRSRGTGLSRS